jgi:hypothetical protein
VTKLLHCLRDELVRRDYAAPTIRSYIQIVEAFRLYTRARLDRLTPAQLRRYHLYLLEEAIFYQRLAKPDVRGARHSQAYRSAGRAIARLAGHDAPARSRHATRHQTLRPARAGGGLRAAGARALRSATRPPLAGLRPCARRPARTVSWARSRR